MKYTISLCIFMCLLSISHAELITNGHFTSNANGWTWVNVDSAGGWRSSGGYPGGGFIINDGGALGSDPTLYQSISGLVIGATYTISGNYILAHGTPVSNAFGVQIDGNLWQYYVDGSWRSFSQTFVATSTTGTLYLTGERNGTDTDPMVDNISLVMTTPVPEPSSILLSILGLCFYFRMRRNK
ncbi:MAG: PEP-CTERM sorting domain-containing protein [Candidatus Brocadiae bacterium]|nr:PEP-CTERM sorting domain-containing protein [Candidatus Brocadiia bacterium]